MCWCCGVIHDKEFVVFPSNCESSAKGEHHAAVREGGADGQWWGQRGKSK